MLNKIKLGEGEFTYEVNDNWEKLPPTHSWREAVSVAVDSKDHVYVFNRGEHPMMVFDKNGNFLQSWGEGLFTRPHGVTYSPDDVLYCTDDGGHMVRKCTLDGEVLMTIGNPNKPARPYSGLPFNRPTDVALDMNTGDFYISDGYGNSRVHKYSPDGTLLFSWGESGTDPGQFNIVHNIATDEDGYVYVADRENHRVQIFNSKGEYQTQWTNMHRACAIFISSQQLVYVGELGWGMPVNRDVSNIGPRISIYNKSGQRLAHVGHLGFGEGQGQFIAPHGICTDSEDSIYVGEVSWTNLTNLGQSPTKVRSFQKLTRTEG